MSHKARVKVARRKSPLSPSFRQFDGKPYREIISLHSLREGGPIVGYSPPTFSSREDAQKVAEMYRRARVNIRIVEKAGGYRLYGRPRRPRPGAPSRYYRKLYNAKKGDARRQFVQSFSGDIEAAEAEGAPIVGATGDPLGQRFMTEGTMGVGRTVEWGTPRDLFDALNCELGPFDIDAAASGDWIAKCADFITPAEDALETEWGDIGSHVFVNPPYGRLMKPFMERAAQQASEGRMVCALVPSRTDTRWWSDSVMGKATEVRLIQGRLKFENFEGGELTSAASAPFPSCVVLFTPPELRPKPDPLTWAGSKMGLQSIDEEIARLETELAVAPHFGLIDRQNKWLYRPPGLEGAQRYLRRLHAAVEVVRRRQYNSGVTFEERDERLRNSPHRRDRWLARRFRTHPVTGTRIPKGENLKIAMAEYLYDHGPATTAKIKTEEAVRKRTSGTGQMAQMMRLDPRFTSRDTPHGKEWSLTPPHDEEGEQ